MREIGLRDLGERLARHPFPGGTPIPLHPAHLEAHAGRGVDVRCLWHEEGDGWIAYPVVLRSVELPDGEATPFRDLENPFEFGGIFAREGEGFDPAVLWRGFFEGLDGWCRAEHVVAEFVRFDPMVSFDVVRLGTRYDVRDLPSHFIFDLERHRDDPMRGGTNPARRNVRRAERAGAVFRSLDPTSGILDRFTELYEGTIRRHGAEERYFLGSEYYRREAEAPYGRLFGVEIQGDLAAVSLLLVNRGGAYHNLTGWDRRYAGLRIHDFLLASLARWAASEGLRWLHLGGGSESVRAFKGKFTRDTVPYRVGMRVVDREAYGMLCWRAGADPCGDGFFPAYRRRGSESGSPA